MSSHPDRDRSTDALLRAALPGLTAGESPACVDAETLAAWSERTLPSADAASVDAHLAGCARCQTLLAAFVRTEPVAAAAAPIWQHWPALKWLVPAATLAGTVVIIAVLTRETRDTALAPPQMARQDAPSAAIPPPASDRLAETPAPPAAPPPARQERAAVSEAAVNDALSRKAGQAAGNRDGAARTNELRQSAAPAAAGTPAAPPPPSPSRQDLTDGAANITLFLPNAAEGRYVAPAETIEGTKLDSVEAVNLPLDQYRNYQALVVLVPSTQPDLAAGARTEAAAPSQRTLSVGNVVVEIPSAPRPAFASTGGRAGRGRGGAAAAAQAAAEATTLANTVPARWRILAAGVVERSANGGATWHPVTVDTRVAVTGGVSPSDLVCWLIGPAGAVLLSTDGLALRRVTFPETADLVSVTAVDGRQATVTTADGHSFVTFDGGASWTRK